MWSPLLLLLSALLLVPSSNAWDSEELEIFDLVEDINQNFYEMLGVQQVNIIIYTKIEI